MSEIAVSLIILFAVPVGADRKGEIKMLTKEEIKSRILDELKDGIDIYADYRDQLEDGSLKELQKRLEERGNETARNVFYDYISELYENCDLGYPNEVKEVCRNQGIDYDELDDDMKEFVDEIFNENVFYNLPYDHYLQQDVCINITVDAGDANYDFGINEVYPHYDGDYDELKRHGVPSESCVTWLAKRQGYSKKALKAALLHDEGKVESKFLQSMYEELLNMTSALPRLVFMKKMTVEEWLELLEKKTIAISKDTRTGLVDFWNGAGGLLGIELEKDFKFDKKFVYEIQPDVCYDYGIMSIYGAGKYIYE